MGNEREIVKECRGCDPRIPALDTMPGCLRGNGRLGPFGAEGAVVRHYGKWIEVEPQPLPASLAPLGLDPPSVQFSQSHKRNHEDSILKVRIVLEADWMVLEKERDNVRINENAAHAAGSGLL